MKLLFAKLKFIDLVYASSKTKMELVQGSKVWNN
jgi:hypothetical protein